MKRSHTYAFVFISISLGFIFILAYLFLVLANPDGSYVLDGLSAALSLIVLAQLTPVFVLLYIAAALILKKYYQNERSAGGSVLLIIAILADLVLWYGWAHESVRSDAMRPLFIPAIAIGFGLWLFLSIAKFSHGSNTNQ
jgi:hypothetical protein